MNMEGVKSLMQEVHWGSLATTNGKTVGVRPMGSWAWIGGELWCATSTSSEKAAQIRMVPHAEYCFGRPDGEHVRISGPCVVSTDSLDRITLYDAVPGLKRLISGPGDPDFAVIRMKPDRIRYRGTSGHGYKEIQFDRHCPV